MPNKNPTSLSSCAITIFITGAVLGIEALKERVSHSSLPSQKVESSRFGVRKVKVKQKDETVFSPLKEGEEAHWEVGGAL